MNYSAVKQRLARRSVVGQTSSAGRWASRAKMQAPKKYCIFVCTVWAGPGRLPSSLAVLGTGEPDGGSYLIHGKVTTIMCGV